MENNRIIKVQGGHGRLGLHEVRTEGSDFKVSGISGNVSNCTISGVNVVGCVMNLGPAPITQANVKSNINNFKVARIPEIKNSQNLIYDGCSSCLEENNHNGNCLRFGYTESNGTHWKAWYRGTENHSFYTRLLNELSNLEGESVWINEQVYKVRNGNLEIN